MSNGFVCRFNLKQPVLNTQLYYSEFTDVTGIKRAVIGDIQSGAAVAIQCVDPSPVMAAGSLYFDVTVRIEEKKLESRFLMLLLGLPTSEVPQDFNQQCDMVSDLLRRAVHSKVATPLFMNNIAGATPDSESISDFLDSITDISIHIHQSHNVGTGRTTNSRTYGNVDIYQMAMTPSFEMYNDLDAIEQRTKSIVEWAAQAEAKLYVEP